MVTAKSLSLSFATALQKLTSDVTDVESIFYTVYSFYQIGGPNQHVQVMITNCSQLHFVGELYCTIFALFQLQTTEDVLTSAASEVWKLQWELRTLNLSYPP